MSAAAILAGILVATPVLAHGPGAGWQYQMGPGMMGYGQACPDGAGMMGCPPGSGGPWGYGMMGPGSMGYGVMGPGMMGPGMMGPGMMGPGMMGYGAGPGMMGYGWGPGAYSQGREISVDDARRFLEQRLQWQGNKRLKLGDVKEGADNSIVADILTQEGSLVERLSIDRRTGQMQLVQ